jgi:uncharacterized protein YybS (DUF2232 family)
LKVPSPNNQPPLALVETAFLASAACLLCLIDNYLLMGKAFLKPFLALPLILVYLRWGKRAGWISVAVSSLLLSVLMGPTRSILFTIPHGFLGIQLGAFWRRGIGWGWSILVGSILDCLGFFFRIWLTSILLGDDLWSYAIARTTDIVGWLFEKLGVLAEPNIWVVQVVAIGLLFLSSLSSLLVIHLAALLLFDRVGGPIPRPPAWLEDALEI